MTLHNQNGLRAELVDNCAVALYVEGVLAVEMTRDEWKQINMALEGVKNEEV